MRGAALLLSVLAVSCLAQLCPNDLPGKIEDILARPQFNRTSWSILVTALNNVTGEYDTLYEHNADKYLLPASNNKVFSTAATLLTLGPDYTYKTPLYYSAENNLLCLVGKGDPSFDHDSISQLAVGAHGLLGGTTVDIQVDDTFFSEFGSLPWPDTWELSDIVSDYGGAPNAMIVAENTFTLNVAPTKLNSNAQISHLYGADVTGTPVINNVITGKAGSGTNINAAYRPGDNAIQIIGSIASDAKTAQVTFGVIQPSLRAGYALSYYLLPQNVKTGKVSVGNCGSLPSLKPLSYVTSAPLSTLMKKCLKESDNLYAETFLNTMGALSNATSSGSTRTDGIAAIKSVLTKFGVDPDTYFQMDGSGVSRRNLVSARAEAQVMAQMSFNPLGSLYQSFLPIAGVDGTLADRFVNTPAQGIVKAKTGTLTGVVALSGYMTHPAYSQVVFSIIENLSTLSSADMRRGLDDIVLLLPSLRNC